MISEVLIVNGFGYRALLEVVLREEWTQTPQLFEAGVAESLICLIIVLYTITYTNVHDDIQVCSSYCTITILLLMHA